MMGDKPPRKVRVTQAQSFQGLNKVPMELAEAGEIVLITGIDDLSIGYTIADAEKLEALPILGVDEPTLTMNFQLNTSPFVGREGKFVTSRQLCECSRLTGSLI